VAKVKSKFLKGASFSSEITNSPFGKTNSRKTPKGILKIITKGLSGSFAARRKHGAVCTITSQPVGYHLNVARLNSHRMTSPYRSRQTGAWQPWLSSLFSVHPEYAARVGRLFTDHCLHIFSTSISILRDKLWPLLKTKR
jgi:hypothetical protein